MKWNLAAWIAGLGVALCGCKPTGSAQTGPAGPGPGAGTVIRHADPAAAEKLLADGQVVVLDVRTPGEFEAGHIKGAKLLDFNAADFASKLGELDRNRAYLLHCASGRRSTKALDTFKSLGFKEVTHLDGGFNAWKAEGKPVDK